MIRYILFDMLYCSQVNSSIVLPFIGQFCENWIKKTHCLRLFRKWKSLSWGKYYFDYFHLSFIYIYIALIIFVAYFLPLVEVH